TRQSCLPSATPTPMSDFSVSATSCLVPSTVIRTGEPYAGPSPVHFHFSSPLARSNATSSPLPRPPRKAMHFPSTMIGETAVKNGGWALESFLHTTLPLAASRQERTPPTPKVQTFPSATAGVLRGPGCPPPGPVTFSAGYLSF